MELKVSTLCAQACQIRLTETNCMSDSSHVSPSVSLFPQVFLPPSVGSNLMGQDAHKNGAPLFQLSTPHGSVTHAGRGVQTHEGSRQGALLMHLSSPGSPPSARPTCASICVEPSKSLCKATKPHTVGALNAFIIPIRPSAHPWPVSCARKAGF